MNRKRRRAVTPVDECPYSESPDKCGVPACERTAVGSFVIGMGVATSRRTMCEPCRARTEASNSTTAVYPMQAVWRGESR